MKTKRRKWKQGVNRSNGASNVEATTNSKLMALARERFDRATVDHPVDEVTVERSVAVVILGLSYQCWRCGDASMPIVGMMEPGRRADSIDFVTCNEEKLLALAWRYLPAEARERFRVGEVRRRYSKTIRSEYLSNGCATASCSALFGEFPKADFFPPMKGGRPSAASEDQQPATSVIADR